MVHDQDEFPSTPGPLGNTCSYDRYLAKAHRSGEPYDEFLPSILGVLTDISKRASTPASSRPYRVVAHDLAGLIDTAFAIIDDTRAHLERVRREATSVMTAASEYLDNHRDRVGYWLTTTESELLKQRAAFAASESSYWQRVKGVKARPGTSRFAGSGNDVEALESIRTKLAQETKNLAEVLGKEPTALFSPVSTLPIKMAEEIKPTTFERLVAALMKRDGFRVDRAQGFSGDNGADVIAIWPIKQKFVVQVKHTTTGRTVPPETIRAAPAAFTLHEADVMVVVTNGRYSRETRKVAKDLSIHLVDGMGVERWLEHGQPLMEILTDG
ncbi:restriction endonuclease [Kitasatospora sp. NPDC059673]|uniref:restriction endonuclease n=1 Tax=Kitasatospora sp. NPDC059673 TaxID=3346901 RepID=UPI003695294C